jgi:putative ABC transport system permease protein
MGVLADLKYAVRLAGREWRFSLTMVTTLAAGIAASGAIFNVVNASLLRPLPMRAEHRVFRLQDYTVSPDGRRNLRSNRAVNFLAIRDEARSFERVVGLRRVEWSLIDGDAPVPVYVALASPGSLDLLGASIRAGRMFAPEEEAAGLDSGVIILSHSLWQRQFGGRTGVIGSTVRVEDRSATIIGVLTPGFRFPYDAEAWMPERIDPSAEASVAAFARLADGVSRSQAEAELDAVAARAEAVRPLANRGLRFAMTPIRESMVGDDARTSLALLGAAILLLLLASANVANLLMARGARRAREIAVRAALGAVRRQQIRQMLIESLVFAAAGTLVGLALAWPLSAAVIDLVPNELRDQLGLTRARIDWRAAVFAAAVTCGVGIIAGLVPALRLSRADVGSALRAGGRALSGGHRLMRALVIAEISLAAALLVSAGLMTDNLQRLLHADLGLRPDRLLSIRMPLPPRYDTAERRIVLARQVIEAAGAIPGIEQAGLVTTNPIDRGSFGAAVEPEARPLAPGESAPIVNHRLVSPAWLSTAGVALLRGRFFADRDGAGGQPVAIVSRRMASRLWPDGDPLGQRIRQTRPGAPWMTVVGVVGDVRDTGEWRETWYLPYDQHAGTLAGSTVHVMVRTRVDAAATLSAMRASVSRLDPLLPVPEPTIMRTMWESAQTQPRLGAVVSAMFAASGLLLAAIGTYGVLAYLVSSRSREFGIRQALGATPQALHMMVLRDGGVLAAAGLAAGTLLSLLVVPALLPVLTDSPGLPAALPWTVAGVLGGAAVAASLVPARRATRSSPVDAMKSE